MNTFYILEVCKSLSNVDVLDVYEDTEDADGGNHFGHVLIVSEPENSEPEDEIMVGNPTTSNSIITPSKSK